MPAAWSATATGSPAKAATGSPSKSMVTGRPRARPGAREDERSRRSGGTRLIYQPGPPYDSRDRRRHGAHSGERLRRAAAGPAGEGADLPRGRRDGRSVGADDGRDRDGAALVDAHRFNHRTPWVPPQSPATLNASVRRPAAKTAAPATRARLIRAGSCARAAATAARR